MSFRFAKARVSCGMGVVARGSLGACGFGWAFTGGDAYAT